MIAMFGLGLPELMVALVGVVLPGLIEAAVLLVAIYFIVRKAVRDELKNR